MSHSYCYLKLFNKTNQWAFLFIGFFFVLLMLAACNGKNKSKAGKRPFEELSGKRDFYLQDNYAVTSENGQILHKINGVSYVAPPKKPSSNDFSIQKEHNANITAVTPYSFYDPSKNYFTFNSKHQWWGEQTNGCIKSIMDAKQVGLEVMLKPHVWVKGDGWCGELSFDSDRKWEPFANGYSEYILRYAKIADSLDVNVFCIGVEFRQTAVDHADFFKKLIREIRQIYKGRIVYAANWDYYQKITFWPDLDYIGVDAYFPVCQMETPVVEKLLEGWQPIKEDLKEHARRFNKPIVFTEYGYRSISKCAGKQWELETGHWNYEDQRKANPEAQKNAYLALYKVFWEEPWFYGGFAWKWYTNHKNAGGHSNTDFTPQNKPAGEILKKYYAKYN